jgi:hypothetical protein
MSEAGRLLQRAKSPAVPACFGYWDAKRTACGAPLPGRQHIDPIEMRSFLSCVVLFDVVGAGPAHRFRHRLTGTEIEGIFGANITGKFIEQTGSVEKLDELYRRLALIADEKVLVYGRAPAPVTTDNYVAYEHLTLPLASDGQTVDMLLGVRCRLPPSERPERYEWWAAAP